MTTAFYFFGGFVDIFLSLMLWFILDDQQKPVIYVDGERVYAVAEVMRRSDINEDCETNEEAEFGSEPMSRQGSWLSSNVSKRMIEQFFIEDEESDCGWQEHEYDIYIQEDQIESIIAE